MDKKDMPRRREAMELRVRRTMAALEKNNMSAYFAQTSEEAVRLVEGLLCAGDTISCGGSVTLDASGVKALMRSGRYNFLDREAVETDAERQAIYRQTFSADAFLTSSNAVTERGEFALRMRLYEAERRLEGGAFARISNAELVNLDNVRSFDLRLSGTILVRLRDGDTTYVSRRYVAQIKRTLGLGGERK